MIEINNKTKSKIDAELVKRVVQEFFKYNNIKRKEISIAFVGDKVIRRLNKKYRQVDRVTDVLSFSGEDNFFGEIIIDYARIKRQAKIFSNSVKEELIFILVHGLLHLLGYDDKTEKGRQNMEELGKKFINKARL